MNGLLEPGYTIHAGDEPVRNAARFEFIQHGQPEFCAFRAVTNPMPQQDVNGDIFDTSAAPEVDAATMQ